MADRALGSNENLAERAERRVPAAPTPPLPELLVKQAADRLHVTCIPARLSILTRPLTAGRVPLLRPMQPRLPGQRELHVHNVLIAPALATGSSRCSRTRWRVRC